MTDAQLWNAIDLRSRCVSVTRIAQHLGLTVGEVKRALSKGAWQDRPRPEGHETDLSWETVMRLRNAK